MPAPIVDGPANDLGWPQHIIAVLTDLALGLSIGNQNVQDGAAVAAIALRQQRTFGSRGSRPEGDGKRCSRSKR